MRYNIPMRKLIPILTVIFLTGCATAPTSKVAEQNGFKQRYVKTSKFNLATYQKILKPGQDIHIYIEGDGYAWITRSMLSKDPSPRSSTVMRLATLDPHPNVVYLARPCQFSPQDLKTVCDPQYWSLGRYSATVVQAINNAITQIKNTHKAKKVHLIGFSGGGTLAVLAASQRKEKDIASIRTIAGNLDLRTMDKIHRTTPLSQSLDPMGIAYSIRNIPQIHFSGAKDKIVPTVVTQNFVKAAQLDPKKLIIVKDADHQKNWHKHWPELLKRKP